MFVELSLSEQRAGFSLMSLIIIPGYLKHEFPNKVISMSYKCDQQISLFILYIFFSNFLALVSSYAKLSSFNLSAKVFIQSRWEIGQNKTDKNTHKDTQIRISNTQPSNHPHVVLGVQTLGNIWKLKLTLLVQIS